MALQDGIVTPPLSNSHKLSNGPEKGMFVKKKKKSIKPKMKREEVFIVLTIGRIAKFCQSISLIVELLNFSM